MSGDTAPVPIVFTINHDNRPMHHCAKDWQVETFSSAAEFLSRPRSMVPNCLILDVGFPNDDGFALQDRLAIDRPETAIIFTARRDEIPAAVRAMKAGAIDFLIEPVAEQTLIAAIQEGFRCSRTILEEQARVCELRARYATLSSRERQVMALVVKGLLNKQVGSELGISVITVKAHRGRVMQKMDAPTFAALVRMAAKLGLAPEKLGPQRLIQPAQFVPLVRSGAGLSLHG